MAWNQGRKQCQIQNSGMTCQSGSSVATPPCTSASRLCSVYCSVLQTMLVNGTMSAWTGGAIIFRVKLPRTWEVGVTARIDTTHMHKIHHPWKRKVYRVFIAIGKFSARGKLHWTDMRLSVPSANWLRMISALVWCPSAGFSISVYILYGKWQNSYCAVCFAVKRLFECWIVVK